MGMFIHDDGSLSVLSMILIIAFFPFSFGYYVIKHINDGKF